MALAVTREEYCEDWLACYTLEWVSAADGTLSEIIAAIQGTIERIVFKPSSDAGETPFSLYDVTLLDRDGIDILSGKGANLSNTAASSVLVTDTTPVLPIATIGLLTLNVAHADSGGAGTHSGTIRIYLRR